jgi:hypothetical protein
MLELAQKHLGTGLRVGAMKKLHLTKKAPGSLPHFTSRRTRSALTPQRLASWPIVRD